MIFKPFVFTNSDFPFVPKLAKVLRESYEMAAKTNKEFQAMILVEAMFSNDASVCQRYGIADRTLRRYRRALPTDVELSGFVRSKKELYDKQWVENCTPVLASALHFLGEAARTAGEAQRKNPAFIAAVAGAVKIVAEIRLTSDVLKERLTNAWGQAEEDRETRFSERSLSSPYKQ